MIKELVLQKLQTKARGATKKKKKMFPCQQVEVRTERPRTSPKSKPELLDNY
jgi:hypothetical protein